MIACEPRPARDVIAGVLAKCCTSTYTEGGELWAVDVGTISLHYLADALLAAGVTVPEPPEPSAVCGAQAVIAGIEFECDREPHTELVHECTDGVGVMRWRDSDDGPVVAWVHDDSDGWPIGEVIG